MWYVASEECMPYSIDAGLWKGVPTLAELTAKGLEVLDNSKGFFMMVEGGKIDWAGHANDAATNLRDVLALDEAVKVAIEFQKKNPDTLIVVTGDHETGGMTMGFAGTGYAFYMDRLANQKCSTDALSDYLHREKPADLKAAAAFLEANFGFKFEGSSVKDPMVLTGAEKAELEKAFSNEQKFTTAVKNIFSHKCGIGWTSGAHTALPVLTTAEGPGAEKFTGFIDNTDIAKILKSLLK